MASKRKRTPKRVEALTHDDASRKNIPTAEYQTALAADDRSPIEVAYERSNRDLDPQLVWRGKDVQDWAEHEDCAASEPQSDAAASYGLGSMPSRARACPSEDRAWLEAICC